MLISKFKGLGLAIVAGTVATTAMVNNAKADTVFTQALLDAYSCSDAAYGTGGTYAHYTDRAAYSASCTTGSTGTSAGSVVTATATLRAAVSQTVGIIGSRIASVKNGNASLRSNRLSVTSFNAAEDGSTGTLGVAGGDAMKGMGVWAQGQYVRMDNSNAATDSDGNMTTIMAGIDKMFANDKGLVGISFGYQDADISTTFNRGTVDGTALIVAPYVSFDVNDSVTVNATAGYANVDYDNARLDPLTSEKFTGSNDGTRLFGSASLNASKAVKSFVLTGTLGANYSRESQSAFTETGTTGTTVSVGSNNAKLGQAIIGGTAMYDGAKADPFINVTGEYDYTKTKASVASNQVAPADDNFGLRVGAGVNFNLGKNVTALVEGNTVLLRDKYKEHTGTVRVRVEF